MADRSAATNPPHREIHHEVLASVLQVHDTRLYVLLWERARAPHENRWALPGGQLTDEDVAGAIQRHLADKVDVRTLSHLEQLQVFSTPDRFPGRRLLATTFLGLVRSDVDPALPPDTQWHPVDELPTTAFDHGEIVLTARERLRAKLSYTNLGFALAPTEFTIADLRRLYSAALGYEVAATNLQRVLTRRGVLVPTGHTAPTGRAGGRPPALFRFTETDLEITDPFAVLRPPGEQPSDSPGGTG